MQCHLRLLSANKNQSLILLSECINSFCFSVCAICPFIIEMLSYETKARILIILLKVKAVKDLLIWCFYQSYIIHQSHPHTLLKLNRQKIKIIALFVIFQKFYFGKLDFSLFYYIILPCAFLQCLNGLSLMFWRWGQNKMLEDMCSEVECLSRCSATYQPLW